MQYKIWNLAIAAVLATTLFVGACNDGSSEVLGLDIVPASAGDDTGNTRSGDDIDQDRAKVQFDDRGIPE